MTNADGASTIVQLFTRMRCNREGTLIKGDVAMEQQGLYDPAHEHDSCGVGFVVDVQGRKSHAIVRKALQVLINLLHRGACGCEPNTGDGAGILVQMPDRFLRRECAARGLLLPAAGEYGAGDVKRIPPYGVRRTDVHPERDRWTPRSREGATPRAIPRRCRSRRRSVLPARRCHRASAIGR